MFVKLLRIDSSPFGKTAISRCLTEEFVHKWLAENHGGAVVTRDLTSTAIPVVDAAWVSANYSPSGSRTHQQNEILKLSAELIAELTDADEYVIGLPMHNFGPPSIFKLWVDQIVTPSTLLERPLAGRRATFIIAAGRSYTTGSPDSNKNYLAPWLRTVFGSLGVSDMQFVIADGTKKVHSGDLDLVLGLAC
jgi:FMN-dependent NADH-azoreductase